MVRKYVRDKATARGAVSRIEGAYLDFDEMPSGTISEADARAFCSSHSMRYRDSFTSATNLFWAYFRKLERTPRRSRRAARVSAPEVIGQEVVVTSLEDGTETRLSPEDFTENASEYPGHKYAVRYVSITKRTGRAFSQGSLF